MKIVDYLMIGATIRIGREILGLPYADEQTNQSRLCKNTRNYRIHLTGYKAITKAYGIISLWASG